jgi:hypothetical protein
MKSKHSNFELPEIIERLKKGETAIKNAFKAIIMLYWIVIAIYVLRILLSKHNFLSNNNIGAILVLIGSVLIVIFFKKAIKNYPKFDISAPTITLLNDIVKRYKTFKYFNNFPLKNIMMFLIGLLLMQIGVTIMIYHSLGFLSPILRIIYVQLAYLFLYLLCAVFGIIVWYKKYKPLINNALNLIKEIEA